MTKTIFEKSQTGQRAFSLPKSSQEFASFAPPEHLSRKTDLPLPEISELDLMRHFSEDLVKKTTGIDNTFYPLGSCTMKYNPRVNELAASLPQFTLTHPLAPVETVQGNLLIISDLIRRLCQISGMTAGSLASNAGAQGEFIGVKLIAAYHRERGETERTEILIPDDAHGTNPATARMAGFSTVPIRTAPDGDLSLEHLKEAVSERTAGLMLTNPNTLGLFSEKILDIAKIVHDAGGLLFYDGANLNAILNIVRPGEMGFDVMHINLHKTFSTPHGGGGPGSGPVLCNDKLKKYLPVPRVVDHNVIWDDPDSIGHISSFHGNFAIYLRAYLYILLHGDYGLRRVAENAVLNANYLKKNLGDLFTIPYPQHCMHEFVIQADNYLDQGIKALDIAKRLIDYGIHPPTIYFPLIVRECFLVEPTETESKATLDNFIRVMEKIVEEIRSDPKIVKQAPYSRCVTRLDEVRAAKHPKLKV